MYKTKKIAHSISLLGLVACIGFTTSSVTAGVLSVNTTAQSTYAKTKYPLLFTHGMFGFSRVGVAEFGLDY